MLFSSNIFLFLFLPIVVIIYYLLGKKFRNYFLLIASLLFYAWGEPRFVFVMLCSIVFNYLMAFIISRSRKRKICKVILALALLGNLSVLFVYKYYDFFCRNVNALGIELQQKNIELPLGISFFTFQALSYVIDVYRGTVIAQVNPANIGLYISFFPQLVAGPIVRYQTIAEQIESRYEKFEVFCEGVKRFIIGFGKKVIIANNMAIIVDAAFGLPDMERSVVYAWIGAIAYSFQILFDFSGYSDMAIGLGKMFGFHFLENFDYPYISASISEFWRRWHISLGQWFRDYVYFPLGGGRVSDKKKLIRNLFFVWILTGIWHGASWNFVFWGLLYFVLISFEKLTGYPKKFKYKWQRILYRIFTLICIVLGWVLFRAGGLKAALKYMLGMLGMGANDFICSRVISTFEQYWFFFIIAIVASTPIIKIVKESVERCATKIIKNIASILTIFFYGITFAWSISYIMIGSHNPFIYFNF